METYKDKPVQELIGDFYEGHANHDRTQMAQALEKLQKLIFTGSIDCKPFMDYFNEIFSGRTAYNTLLAVNDYPKESIFRELLQNTFGCYYKTKDIKVVVNFRENCEISLSYNEVGFTMEQFLYYLSFGRNDGDITREGRFGVGAKSVFMNVEWLSMRSNNFSFRIKNNNGVLKIQELNLLGTLFSGTEIVIKVSEDEYAAIKDNFMTITEKRGTYINLVELCFAFNRKKVLDITSSSEEALDRTFNIAVMDCGKLTMLYKIFRNQRTPESTPTIRFMQNKQNVIDFICYEDNGFVYLIPFAVATAKREDIVHVLLEKYNYFSTYELTGLMKASGERFVDEKLSAFFVSVPNKYITSHRTGVRHESEEEVVRKMEVDLLSMVVAYSKYFVLDLQQLPNSDKYFMHPKSYAFEFFKNFIQTSRLARNIRLRFQDNISIQLPGTDAPMVYSKLKETAYSSVKKNITGEQHEDGSAYNTYIIEEHAKMQESLADIPDKTLYTAYEWESTDGTQKGREFLYDFEFGGNHYLVESERNPAINDYNLYYHFNSLVGLQLSKYLGPKGEIADETALENALALFDSVYEEDYKIVMKYYVFYISHNDEKFSFEVSKIVVQNLKNAINAVAKRQNRFDTHQTYNDVVSMLVNSFTQGKDTMSFLREIKAQGGEITLQLDINKKYRFSAYGKQFMIPSRITNQEMLEIVGEVQVLIKCGMLNGRVFDFPYTKGRYTFENAPVTKLIGSETLNEGKVAEMLERVHVCDLKIDRIALIDDDGKIIDIVDMNTPISEDKRSRTAKYIVLRDDYTKPEFAEAVEFIVTGVNNHILSKYFSRTTEPNQILPDQIPYYLKPIAKIKSDEFKYLRRVVKNIAQYKGQRVYKNYFAKDVSSKHFGYGGICPICGHETRVINSFTVKDFEVGLLKGETETNFRFSLYLCTNDAMAADGWMIEDVSIGGMSPFLWLDEVAGAEEIPSEFLFCTVRYRPQLTFEVLGVEGSNDDNVVDAAREVMNFTLTPLMAAKWVEDNIG